VRVRVHASVCVCVCVCACLCDDLVITRRTGVNFQRWSSEAPNRGGFEMN
jgi:biotin synthase-related radical SAM superfamily protein